MSPKPDSGFNNAFLSGLTGALPAAIVPGITERLG